VGRSLAGKSLAAPDAARHRELIQFHHHLKMRSSGLGDYFPNRFKSGFEDLLHGFKFFIACLRQAVMDFFPGGDHQGFPGTIEGQLAFALEVQSELHGQIKKRRLLKLIAGRPSRPSQFDVALINSSITARIFNFSALMSADLLRRSANLPARPARGPVPIKLAKKNRMDFGRPAATLRRKI